MDTEPLWYEAEQKFANDRGTSITKKQTEDMVGKAMVVTSRMMKDWTGAEESPEEIGRIIIDMVREAVSERPPLWRPGMERLVKELKDHGVPLALVSSAPRQIIDAVLAKLPEGTFQAVYAAEDVEFLKPDPDPYLRAAAALGVEPSQCVVLEDSDSGIESARLAGTNVIGIPCVLEIPPAKGLSRFESGEDLTVELLGRISRGEVIDQMA